VKAVAYSASQRVVLLSNSVALGLGVILLAIPTQTRAADLDIPRLQVEAERGSIKEEVELGAAYFAGRGVAQDEKRAAYWYEKAANAGDPGAQKQIGYFYDVGIGVKRDPAQAVRWYQRAVAGGLISAKVNLGVAFLLGESVAKDPALAQDLFRQAYAQGNGLAACYLGEMYFRGIGVERDEAAGERWYEAGAKLHDPRAEFQLANLLWHRQKNEGEMKKAIKLLRESGGTGMVAAKHQLGVILVKKPELAATAQEAQALLKEAAEAGEWRSSVALGLLSRDGMGVPADPRTAYYHYRVAALQGGDEALKIVANDLESIAARLGPEQTVAIDTEAKMWFGNHHLALQFIHKDGGKWKEYPTYAVANPEDGVHAGRLIPTDPLAGYMGEPNRRLSAY
jgi:TPR repeat protein